LWISSHPFFGDKGHYAFLSSFLCFIAQVFRDTFLLPSVRPPLFLSPLLRFQQSHPFEPTFFCAASIPDALLLRFQHFHQRRVLMGFSLSLAETPHLGLIGGVLSLPGLFKRLTAAAALTESLTFTFRSCSFPLLAVLYFRDSRPIILLPPGFFNQQNAGVVPS